MKKEIFKSEHVYGNGDKSISLTAVLEYDQFMIDPTEEPCDNVRITVKDTGKVIHEVFIGFQQLEAIYLAAKEARDNR
ncbi:hypothetical protein [Brevibacillus agri]|uniref:hypothetical protein n=1 Tax=Brevibacillus agri TaxID=51101 RepID=UPI002867C9BC|nr:hypothetical protein [Brevibacillus agri]